MSQSDVKTQFYDKSDMQLSESIAFLIVKNSLIFGKLADISLAPLDISSSQTRILMVIGCQGCLMASSIAKKLGSNAGGVVRALDKLENKGWIERIRSDVDRREVHLALTPAGTALLKKVPEYLFDSWNEALTGFTQEEFGTLTHLLTRLTENNLRHLENREKKEH